MYLVSYIIIIAMTINIPDVAIVDMTEVPVVGITNVTVSNATIELAIYKIYIP